MFPPIKGDVTYSLTRHLLSLSFGLCILLGLEIELVTKRGMNLHSGAGLSPSALLTLGAKSFCTRGACPVPLKDV